MAHTIADAVVKSMKIHARKESDVYPTPPEATQAIIPYLDLPPGATIREPCCGDGDMAMVLEANGFKVLSTDLRYTGYGQGGVDFTSEWPFLPADAAVFNPPFHLAEEFIKRATALYPVVAVLLKVNYWNTLRRGDEFWTCYTPTGRHDLTWRLAFLEEERGKAPLMDCTWFIWDRRKPKIDCPPLVRPHPSLVPDVSVKPVTVHLKRLESAFDDLIGTLNGGA